MQADAALPLFGFVPHNLALYNDVHVVFPLIVVAALAQLHSTHGRLAEKFGRFIHVVSRNGPAESACRNSEAGSC